MSHICSILWCLSFELSALAFMPQCVWLQEGQSRYDETLKLCTDGLHAPRGPPVEGQGNCFSSISANGANYTFVQRMTGMPPPEKIAECGQTGGASNPAPIKGRVPPLRSAMLPWPQLHPPTHPTS